MLKPPPLPYPRGRRLTDAEMHEAIVEQLVPVTYRDDNGFWRKGTVPPVAVEGVWNRSPLPAAATEIVNRNISIIQQVKVKLFTMALREK